MKIVFFGTPEFAAFSLKAILNAGYDVAAVVTMPDKIAGRGHKLIQSDVKKVALEHSLPLLQPDKLRDPEFLTQLRALHADLFVVIAFRMLPEVVWAMPPRGPRGGDTSRRRRRNPPRSPHDPRSRHDP